jgi:hypothetical protein
MSMNANFASCIEKLESSSPDTLDKMTWCRISMSGIDHNHKEQEVFVPDFDPEKTTLGFSWIMADSYEEPTHKHGWVSSPDDIKTEMENRKVVLATDRLPFIEERIKHYVEKHNPQYVRLLSNCLQPELIPERHKMLCGMAVASIRRASSASTSHRASRSSVGRFCRIHA